jgi:hypothetical protein
MDVIVGLTGQNDQIWHSGSSKEIFAVLTEKEPGVKRCEHKHNLIFK